MAKKVKVNAEVCIGCGLCVGNNPTVFDFDADGHAHVVGQPADDATAEAAAADCPVGAIEVE